PRVRIAKIFTDLPLAADEPLDFGVTETCNACRRCSNACPVKAIPQAEPSYEPHGISNLKGVKKWTIDAEKCFKFWTNQGTDCSICIRVCPYNRDFSKIQHRLIRWMMGNQLRGMGLWLDEKLQYGERKTAGWWWDK
ncbi:MAG: 4Fe-4S double cluster binding domain-containing protein, partial [Aggregatilineales bacterium]